MSDAASPEEDLLADWPDDDRQLFYAIAGASETNGRSFVTPADKLQRGSIIASAYRLEEILGVGGMGVAWLAQQLALDRLVVVKLMRQQQIDQSTAERQRFVREARAAAAVQHPHVVTVHDLGHHEGSIPFMVMERLEGDSLDKYVQRHGPVRWSRVQGLIAQLLDALYAVHSAGIVHRDLKPSNLMRLESRSTSDFIKLIDFGIATNPQGLEPTLTADGAAPGSLPYMSPEQMAGRADQRSDLYSVGCIILYLLSGRTPMPGIEWTPTRIRHVVARGCAQAPRAEAISAVVDYLTHLLAPNHDHRLADAETALDALQCLPNELEQQDHRVQIIRPTPSATAQPSRWRALPPLLATSAISAMIGLQWSGDRPGSNANNTVLPTAQSPESSNSASDPPPTTAQDDPKPEREPAQTPSEPAVNQQPPPANTRPESKRSRNKNRALRRSPSARPQAKQSNTEQHSPQQPQQAPPKNPGWLPAPPRELSGTDRRRPRQGFRLVRPSTRLARLRQRLRLWAGIALLTVAPQASAATVADGRPEPDVQLEQVASQLQATMESGNFKASVQRCRDQAPVRENSSDLEMADYTDYLCASAFTELIAQDDTQALRDATEAHMQILRRAQASHSTYSKQLRRRSRTALLALAGQWRAQGRPHEANVACACAHSQTRVFSSPESGTCPVPSRSTQRLTSLPATECHAARLAPPRAWMLVPTRSGPRSSPPIEAPFVIHNRPPDQDTRQPRTRKHTALWAWLGALGTLGGTATITLVQLMEPMMVASGRLRQPWTPEQKLFMAHKFPARQRAWTAGGAVVLGAGLSALITATVQHTRRRRRSAAQP